MLNKVSIFDDIQLFFSMIFIEFYITIQKTKNVIVTVQYIAKSPQEVTCKQKKLLQNRLIVVRGDLPSLVYLSRSAG